MNNKTKGNWGEEQATKLLQRKGYTIMERNFFFQKLEADIICRKNNVLVFVEVKTRDYGTYGDAAEAIPKQKIRNYFQIAKFYVLKKKLVTMDIRFDVILVIRDNIQHIENAFDASYLS